jgi:hypothetical protein
MRQFGKTFRTIVALFTNLQRSLKDEGEIRAPGIIEATDAQFCEQAPIRPIHPRFQ